MGKLFIATITICIVIIGIMLMYSMSKESTSPIASVNVAPTKQVTVPTVTSSLTPSPIPSLSVTTLSPTASNVQYHGGGFLPKTLPSGAKVTPLGNGNYTIITK